MSDIHAAIDRAKPFLDEGWSSDDWAPSALLRIGYCTLLTTDAPDAVELAESFANRHLEEARRRYAAGFLANPFGVEAVR